MKITTPLVGVIVGLFILASLNGISYASTNIVTHTESEINTMSATLNTQKALSLAESTPAFQTYSVGYEEQFNSIFNTWSFNSQGAVTWKTVNVVYSISNSTGFKANLVITESPGLLGVIGTALQISPMTAGTSTNWSGYTFSGNSGSSTPVYEAYATWTVPSVSEPQSYFCYFAHCDLSIWPGLTAQSGGSSGIVQAGTDSGLYCTAGCSYYYYGWYEFYPAGSVTCSSFPVSPGDSVGADIVNSGEYGGSTTSYAVYVYDFTAGNTCSTSKTGYSGFTVPYYGQFIAERPSFGGTLARLPKFGSVTMSGDVYYGSSLTGIYTPYSYGWYIKTTMVNSGNTNINVGSVSSSSSFTQTWSTSSGT
jgi:Peptidase A4 family